MNKSGMDGPISVIIMVAMFIFVMAFVYPILKSVFTWMSLISSWFKLAFLILTLGTIYAIIKSFNSASQD